MDIQQSRVQNTQTVSTSVLHEEQQSSTLSAGTYTQWSKKKDGPVS